MSPQRIFAQTAAGLAAVLTPGQALAEAASLSQANGDIMWTLIAAILVMFMQPGFALLECGLVRTKNAANIVMKNFADFAIGAGVFYVLGFGLMFGDSARGFVGTSLFCLGGMDAATTQGQWTLTFCFFQSVFAATAATIVSGGTAERMRFSGYMLASLLISALIYPVSGHWAWAGLYGNAQGWLGELGFVDFAGSSVVHSLGGWIAFAGAIVLGPRLGKYGPDGKARAIMGHNLPLTSLGVFILWFAWFGFNCGSTTSANGNIGYIAVNTNLAACFGFLGAMAAIWLKTGKPDPSMSFNGVLAGLVGITAGCLEVSPFGAMIIGFLSGVLAVLSILFIDQVLRVDDPVGAVSVHGVCGAFGTVMVGLLAAPGYGEHLGLLYGGSSELLLTQVVGVLAVFAWAFGFGFIVFKVLDRFFGLRVSPQAETEGLDLAEHSTEAYSGFQIFTNE
ncbi:MAG: ammonium transporter [Desulfovibrio sp.]|jgi:Amt family ammonium transporter|nr:ammonium transporter [Desulfovibrio sp.]